MTGTVRKLKAAVAVQETESYRLRYNIVLQGGEKTSWLEQRWPVFRR
jgi:hypothetical protein